MKRDYFYMKRLSKIFLTVFFTNIVSTIYAFYPVTWEDLMYQMKKRMSWNSAKLETTVKIFDPVIKNFKKDIKSYPRELPSKGYNQIIYWKDGEVLVVKTKDEKEKLLHYYYENDGDLLSISLDDNRTFSTKEVLPIQLIFKSRFQKDRIKALEEFGIFNKKVSYHMKDNKNIFLCIGNFESGHFALINPKNYELSSLHTKIWNGDGTWLELKIIFKRFLKYRWQLYPEITEYFLNDRLFKKVKITKIRTLSSLPIKELKKEAVKFKSPQKTSLINDYAL